MRDEIDNVRIQLENALFFNLYDTIIVLDDGSSDGTYDILKEYSNKYNNIEIHRNEVNSVLNNMENRWYTLYKYAAAHEPTWINHRAADVIYPRKCAGYFKSRMENLTDTDVVLITFPFINLWRSNTWYRNDGVWGEWAVACDTNIYRFNKNASWSSKFAGVHLGATKPNNLGFKICKNVGINSGLENNYIVGLHLAHTTHEKIAKRFEWYMEAAKKSRNAVLLPPPDKMPHPSTWSSFNSYKIFDEFNIKFKKGLEYWFDDLKFCELEPPKVESLFDVIYKYNRHMALEYQKLFEEHYGNN